MFRVLKLSLRSIKKYQNYKFVLSDGSQSSIYEIFNILDSSRWYMENKLSAWEDGEEKLRAHNAIIKYVFDINDFRHYVENKIRGKGDIPETVKGQAIFNSVAVSSAEAEKSFS
jgi:hypothetical protein